MGLCVLAVALSIAWRQLLLSRRFSSPNRVLGLATSYVSFVAAAAGNLTDIMVVLTLVNLGFGIISMREARTTDAVAPGSKRGGIHNARFGAYGFGAVVGCLHVAVFALRCHIEADVSKGSSNSDLYLTLGTQVNRLAFAVGFLLLLAASCMVCWSIMTVITAKKHAQQSRTVRRLRTLTLLKFTLSLICSLSDSLRCIFLCAALFFSWHDSTSLPTTPHIRVFKVQRLAHPMKDTLRF